MQDETKLRQRLQNCREASDMQCMASAVVTPLDDIPAGASPGSPATTDAPVENRRADDRRRPQATDGQTLTGFSCLIIGSLSLAFVLTGYLSGNDVVPLLVTSGTGLVGCSICGLPPSSRTHGYAA
jgi:hypothetical protein